MFYGVKLKKKHYKSVVKNDGNAKRWAIEYSVLDNALYSIDIEYHDCYSEHGLFNKKWTLTHRNGIVWAAFLPHYVVNKMRIFIETAKNRTN